jgi:hypothetical protein
VHRVRLDARHTGLIGAAGGVMTFLASIVNLATAVVNRRGTSRKPSSGGGQQ